MWQAGTGAIGRAQSGIVLGVSRERYSTDEAGARKNRRTRRKNNLPQKNSSLMEKQYHI